MKCVLRHAENVLYRMCGLPMVVRTLFGSVGDSDKSRIDQSYAAAFWSPDTTDQWLDVVLAAALFPMAVLAAALWYSMRNGRVVASRCGRTPLLQFLDQLRLAVTAGILPPWYYVFELFLPGNRSNAAHYLSRAQTKQCVYPRLNSQRDSVTVLGDKAAFASFCEERQLPTAPVVLVARRGEIEWRSDARLPERDLFIKPANGCGGKGAERWDYAGDRYCKDGRHLVAAELVERVRRRSCRRPLLVQDRLENHPALDGFGTGALSTVRVLTCLDERGLPETIAAVFRMAIGANRTVDNLHAGGIAAAVDLESGRLGSASNLGTDARLGWVDRHPDTGRPIRGETLPMWADVLDLVRRAHGALESIAIVGWDVGFVASGPVLVEGNYGPDVDIMQRQCATPQGRGRFAELIAWHFRQASPARS